VRKRTVNAVDILDLDSFGGLTVPIPDSVAAAMRQTNQLFNSEVSEKRNFTALDRVYTADARILPPGAPMVQGREAIKGFWQQAMAGMDVKSVVLATVDAEMAGDSVVEIGRADLSLNNGQTVTVKYVVHWKQEDGLWKWQTDIWNPNQ
jgi:ketosteroid isomerase-like protein